MKTKEEAICPKGGAISQLRKIKEPVVLIDQRSFGRPNLIKRDAIELRSRRPLELETAAIGFYNTTLIITRNRTTTNDHFPYYFLLLIGCWIAILSPRPLPISHRFHMTTKLSAH